MWYRVPRIPSTHIRTRHRGIAALLSAYAGTLAPDVVLTLGGTDSTGPGIIVLADEEWLATVALDSQAGDTRERLQAELPKLYRERP